MRPFVLYAGVLAVVACSARPRSEAIDLGTLSPSLRADYEIFAQRCSKCHSLDRPFLAGVRDDNHWKRYVERMRLTPGSGLMSEDEAPILRFLHYYSVEQQKRRKRQPTVEEPGLAGGSNGADQASDGGRK